MKSPTHDESVNKSNIPAHTARFSQILLTGSREVTNFNIPSISSVDSFGEKVKKGREGGPDEAVLSKSHHPRQTKPALSVRDRKHSQQSSVYSKLGQQNVTRNSRTRHKNMFLSWCVHEYQIVARLGSVGRVKLGVFWENAEAAPVEKWRSK